MPKGIRRKLDAALRGVNGEIARFAGDGDSKYGRGLASEGFDGGYAAALMDVHLALNGVTPERWQSWAEYEALQKRKRGE